jgi:hypothetical protein
MRSCRETDHYHLSGRGMSSGGQMKRTARDRAGLSWTVEVGGGSEAYARLVGRHTRHRG